MDILLDNIKKYNFSFTGAGLRVHQFELVLQHLAHGEPLDIIQQIGNGKRTTGERIYGDLNKRYQSLTADQVEVFLKGDLITRRQIAFLSVCKTYAFIRDFTLEVLRENMLVFNDQISESDFVSFIRRKSAMHEELLDLSESTLKKARQMTFKILEEAGMIDTAEGKNIQPQLLNERIIEALMKDDPRWLMIFMVSDLDIKNRMSDEENQ